MFLIFCVLLLNKCCLLKRHIFLKWLKHEIERAGAMFIKMAQMCSMLNGHIDEDLLETLRGLQSSVKTEKIHFKVDGVHDIDYNTPVASGSIAQIYKGVYMGQDVAIKVMRPSVKKQMHSLRHIGIYTGLMKFFAPDFTNTFNKLNDFSFYVKRQTSFENECKNMELFDKLFNDAVIIPKVYHELCTDTVIVMDYIKGFNTVYEIQTDQEACKKMISSLKHVMSQMLFSFGIMHTDFQPGNVCWDKQNEKLVLFDFGAVYKLSEEIRDSLVHMNINFCLQRWTEAAHNHMKLMYENYDEIKQYPEFFSHLLNLIEQSLVSSESIVVVIEEAQKAIKERRYKTIYPFMRREILEYEIFTVQISQLVQILGGNDSFIKSVIEMSLYSTLDTLKHRCQDINNNEEHFMSI